MARRITRFAHNQCAECGINMREVIYIRPFAKVCTECRSNRWSVNSEVKKIQEELKIRNSKMTPRELEEDESFVDDPRAEKEIEYGKVIKRPTTIDNNVNMLERNHHV